MKIKGRICDICGEPVYRHGSHEYKISKRFPEWECFWSKIDLCEDCYRKMEEWIMEHKGEYMEDEYEQYNIDPNVLNESIRIKTGKWVKVPGYATPGGDPVWCCSECGKGIHVYGIEHGTYGEDIADGQWKACPNCGCLMLGE